MDQIIEDNMNLIYAIAKYFKHYNSKEDLYQAGALGLLKAYNNYDSSYGVKFSTYAYTYIMGEMKKLVREDKSIRINRDIISLNKKIEEVKNKMAQKLSRMPTNEEVSDFLDIDVKYINEAQESNNAIDSLDYVFNDDGKDLTLYDIIGSRMDVDTILELDEQLNRLNPEERQIILARYMEDLTQQEVANKLGMNQVQVSRKESKVLVKLKQGLTI